MEAVMDDDVREVALPPVSEEERARLARAFSTPFSRQVLDTDMDAIDSIIAGHAMELSEATTPRAIALLRLLRESDERARRAEGEERRLLAERTQIIGYLRVAGAPACHTVADGVRWLVRRRYVIVKATGHHEPFHVYQGEDRLLGTFRTREAAQTFIQRHERGEE